MAVNIIYSRSGTGKSYECLKRIKSIADSGGKAYMIVPEQFSYEAERRVSEAVGGTGINGIEALTFSRLLELLNLTPSALPRIDGAGKQMLIYKAAESIGDKGFFGKSLANNGFLDSISQMIGEFKRFNISPSALDEMLDKLAESEKGGIDMVRYKLDSITKIFKVYNESLENNFIDSDDDMARLAECIYSCDDLADTHIFIDEYYAFIPYHYSVISALAEKAADVSIFLCADREARFSYNTENIFSPCLKIIYTLENMAKENGFVINEEYLSEETHRFKSDALRMLESSFDKPAVKMAEGDISDIHIFMARDIFSEVERAALEIIESVKNGYRYSEIGMMCGDLENYADIIETVFSKYHIPYFIDMKKNITNHPIIMAVMSIFSIFTQGWSYDAVFSYIRTGFSALTDAEADALENFVLAHGIRGEKKWCEKDWEYRNQGIFDAAYDKEAPDFSAEYEFINGIRRKLTAPFIRFKNSFDGRKTIREICAALFSMLDEDLNMPYKIKMKAEQFRAEGKNDESEQFLKLWDIFVSLLDQAVAVMGDDHCGFERFGEIILAGFSKYEIGIIPSSADRISIGTVDRSRSINIKEMIIIGASNKNIPKSEENRTLFSDAERKKLTDGGLEIDGGKREALFDEQFKIYKALTSAKERLYISWPTSDWEGGEMRPAEFINDIKRRFPDISIDDNLLGDNIECYFNAPADSVFSHMLAGWTEGKDSRFDKIMDWYRENPEFKERTEYAESLRDYKRKAGRLEHSTVAALYGSNPLYSISSLETFAKCPFQYFMKYGICAKPQKIWKVENYDVGNFIHYYIDKFCRAVESERKDDTLAETKRVWNMCDDEKCAEIIASLIGEARERLLKSGITARLEHMVSMIEKSLKKAAENIIKSLCSGEFSLYQTELDFDDFVIRAESGENIRIRGFIDRIDLFAMGDEVYIRVIDYKTGSKKFDLTELYNNAEFQLFIYAQAAAKIYSAKFAGENAEKNIRIAGVLYFSIHDDYKFVDTFKDSSKIEGHLDNMKKLDGIIVDDTEKLTISQYMDRELLQTNKSEFFNVGLTVKNKKSQMSAKSMVITPENFNKICAFVNKNAADIHEKIMSGDISIYPYDAKKDKCVCDWCDFSDICMFDAESSEYRRKEKFMSGNGNSGFQTKINYFMEAIKDGADD